MSRTTPSIPTTSPLASRMGVETMLTGMASPLRKSRWRSRWATVNLPARHSALAAAKAWRSSSATSPAASIPSSSSCSRPRREERVGLASATRPLRSATSIPSPMVRTRLSAARIGVTAMSLNLAMAKPTTRALIVVRWTARRGTWMPKRGRMALVRLPPTKGNAVPTRTRPAWSRSLRVGALLHHRKQRQRA